MIKSNDLIKQLRPWQNQAYINTINFIHNFKGRVGARLMQSAPTGSGKSYPQLASLLKLRENGSFTFLLTPSLVIIRGLLAKLEVEIPKSKKKAVELAFELGISTPTRLRNKIQRGEIGPPDGIIVDETHEFVKGNSVPDFFLSVCPTTPLVGFTATPYRGTVRGTAQLKETWTAFKEMVKINEAVEEGWIHFPRVKVVPLVDDDVVKVVDGKFQVSSLDEITFSRAQDLVDLACEFHSGERFDKGTVLALPSTRAVLELAQLFKNKGIDPCVVLNDTSEKDRLIAIEKAAQRKGILLQIKVLERGFDEARFRRLIDAKPTLSPVALMQLWGRIMRPHIISNEVIVTNRNLERHHYLFEGQVPKDKVAEAAEGFGGFSNRFIARHTGLESLGRFKVLKAPLKGGGEMPFYHLQKWEQKEATTEVGQLVHYMIIIHPYKGEIISARRTGSGHKYSDWKRCELPSDFNGFQTNKKNEGLHPKIQKWWKGRAGRYGLDRHKWDSIQTRVFDILPFLTDLQLSIRKGD